MLERRDPELHALLVVRSNSVLGLEFQVAMVDPCIISPISAAVDPEAERKLPPRIELTRESRRRKLEHEGYTNSKQDNIDEESKEGVTECRESGHHAA